jgi:hypothetical protein
MAWTNEAHWYDWRAAQNRKPAQYRCPLCGRQLPAMSDHMLLFPDGDHSRRRHAHAACVFKARREGRLPTRSEWLKTQSPAAQGRPGRRLSAKRILCALRPRLRRSRPSDS